MAGRDYVAPDDVQAILPQAVAHRLLPVRRRRPRPDRAGARDGRGHADPLSRLAAGSATPAAVGVRSCRRPAFRHWWQSAAAADRHLAARPAQHLHPADARPGWPSALTLLVMLLASINYQLNLGYALTFLLAGAGLVSMHLTHGNLRGLTLHLRPTGAGVRRRAGAARGGDRPTRRATRHGIGAALRGPAPPAAASPGATRRRGGQAVAHLSVVPPRRGWHAVPPLVVETRLPVRPVPRLDRVAPGVARARVAAPRSAAAAAARGDASAAASSAPARTRRRRRARRRARLAPRRHACARWRGRRSRAAANWSAARPPAPTRASCGSTGPTAHGAGDVEQRLSRLTAWVLAAERDGIDYGLRLPGRDSCARPGRRAPPQAARGAGDMALTIAAGCAGGAGARLAHLPRDTPRHAVPPGGDRLDGRAAPAAPAVVVRR